MRHRRKTPFSPLATVDREVRHIIQSIHDLDHELDRFILGSSDYLELVTEAYASNIYWSTRMEGNPLTEEEVVRLTRRTVGGQDMEENPGPQQEIINHLYAYFFKDQFHLPWTVQSIKAVHAVLMEGTGTPGPWGEFRKAEAVIKNGGSEAFIPCPAQHIDDETSSLLDWLNTNGQAFETLVCSTLLFHEFESIHPFEDGNGRVGRTLFHLLLQDMGLTNSKLCKIENHLLGRPSQYYDLLAYTDESGSYGPLIEYFAICVQEAYEEALSLFRSKDVASRDMDETTLRIVRMARRNGDWFTVRQATEWVNGLGEQSVRSRLSSLVDGGVLQRTGRTAGTRFRFLDPFEPFKRKVSQMGYERIGSA